MFRKLRTFVFVALPLLLAAACQPGPAPTPTPTVTPSVTPEPTPTLTPTPGFLPRESQIDPGTATTVQFVLAASDVALVDLYLERDLIASRMVAVASTKALTLSPGRYQVRIVPSGEGQDSAGALFDGAVELAPGETALVVFSGSANQIAIKRYTVDTSPLTSQESARIRVIDALPADVANGAVSITLDEIAVGEVSSAGELAPPDITGEGRKSFRVTGTDGSSLLNEFIQIVRQRAHVVVLHGTREGRPSLTVLSYPLAVEARIRVANASQLWGAVDVYAGAQLIAGNLTYLAAFDYQIVPAETISIRILPPGASPEAEPLYAERLALLPSDLVTLVLYDTPGRQSITSAGGAFEPRIQVVRESADPTEATEMRLTVFNAARLVTDAQVYDPDRVIEAIGALDSGKLSETAVMRAGERVLRVTGQLEGSQRTIERVASFNYEAGVAYLYIVTGPDTITPLMLSTSVGVMSATITPTASVQARVRFVNLGAGAGPVDVFIGERRVFAAVPAEAGSLPTLVDSNLLPIRITRAGESKALAETQFAVSGSEDVLILLIGSGAEGGPGFQVIQTIERLKPSATTAVVRVIHAAPETVPFTVNSPVAGRTTNPANPQAPTVTPRTVQQFSRIEPLDISQPRTMRAGSYALLFNSAIDFSVLAQLDSFVVESGKRYELALVAPASEGGSPRIIVVVTDYFNTP